MTCIAILGEYTPTFEPHIATDLAIAHSRSLLASEIEAHWISTQEINSSLFDTYAGILVAPGVLERQISVSYPNMRQLDGNGQFNKFNK